MLADWRIGHVLKRKRPGSVVEDALEELPATRAFDVLGEPKHEILAPDVIAVECPGAQFRSLKGERP